MSDERKQKHFKNKVLDADDLRRRRSSEIIQLRKQRKEDQLVKKRNVDLCVNSVQASPESSKPITELDVIVREMYSDDIEQKLNATICVRKLLSSNTNPPIDKVISYGIVPRCVEFLSSKNTQLQFEACWVLTNVASGNSEQTLNVVTAGAISRLCKLLYSSNDQIIEQAVWALGNIAGDSSNTRDLVINHDILPQLLTLVRPDTNTPLLKNITWLISNMCRNRNPRPDFNLLKAAIPTLVRLLYSNDESVVVDACWALSYLTDGSNDQIQVVIETNAVQRFVDLLDSESTAVLSPALRCVGNIVTGNDEQTEIALRCGTLKKLNKLLHHPKSCFVRESAWAISNITAGNAKQLQQVVDSNILPSIVKVLSCGDFRSQKEAAWAITNFIASGSIYQVQELIKCNAVQPLCNLLNSNDPKTIQIVLDGIFRILEASEATNLLDQITYTIEECEGLDLLEKLQSHENEQIYQKALNIIERYFQNEDEDQSIPNDFSFTPTMMLESENFNF